MEEQRAWVQLHADKSRFSKAPFAPGMVLQQNAWAAGRLLHCNTERMTPATQPPNLRPQEHPAPASGDL